ncbi:GNAT family N-acetyltransferase [Mesorhizobium sp. LjNodule214]|uniref:GNAT family N-acetyltransferase n=1 Tax=Mesorhizobium sp. LjNodule214 TaxID=3342252 RepID=UPI003ECC3DB1
MATGTWYISAAAIYPEHQSNGFGKSLLAEAESIARAAQKDRLTLESGADGTGPT